MNTQKIRIAIVIFISIISFSIVRCTAYKEHELGIIEIIVVILASLLFEIVLYKPKVEFKIWLVSLTVEVLILITVLAWYLLN